MNTRTKVVLGTIAAAAFMRVLPHPPNVSPVIAMGLFGGALCANRRLAFAVPLLALFVSDALLELATPLRLYHGWMATGWGFHSTWWGVYGGVALVTALSMLLRGRRTAVNIAAATVASAVLYFLITNFAEWMVGTIGYPKTFAGLLECYAAALAFYRQTWAPVGDAVYVTALFGGFALAERYVPALRPAPSPA
jgi:hypothetical protein